MTPTTLPPTALTPPTVAPPTVTPTAVAPTAAPRGRPGPGAAHAVVANLDVGVIGCTFTLIPPTLVESRLRVDVLPDPLAARRAVAGHRQALAVWIRWLDAGPECSVLCSTAGGPRHVDVSLAGALALCQAGVHTICVPNASS